MAGASRARAGSELARRPPAPALQPGTDGLERARGLAEAILDRSSRLDGDGRLPTERLLATEHGVSRAAVRNALAVLAAEGRISRQVGRGTFLIASPHRPPALESSRPVADDISPADVLAARRLIEPQLAPLVVARATERDLAEIERCLRESERAVSTDQFEFWDLALHHSIVVASHNPLLVRLYQAIEAARRGEIWGNLKRHNDSAERRSARHAEHRRIVEGLRSRDAVVAVEAMEDHLEQVARSMLGDDPAVRLVATVRGSP